MERHNENLEMRFDCLARADEDDSLDADIRRKASWLSFIKFFAIEL